MEKPEQIIVLDIETTGFRAENDMIVEIGMCYLNLETYSISPLFSCVCKEKNKTINAYAWIFRNSSLELIHVKNALFLESYREILQHIFDLQIPITAYNNAFDFGFLEYRDFTIPKKSFDPQFCMKDIIRIPHHYYELKIPSVTESYQYLFPEIEYNEEHRAMLDCIDEAKIIGEILKRKYYIFE